MTKQPEHLASDQHSNALDIDRRNIETIEFWFDPVCPWTWITSRWMTEVRDTLGLDVTWRPFSLQILNEGKEGGPSDSHARGYLLGQVLMHVKEQHGNEAVWNLYTELGNLLHHDKRKDIETVLPEAIAATGLSADAANVPGNNGETLEQALRESTEAGLKAVGPGVGIPIISINGNAFFGPVVSPRPKGEDAMKLWYALYYSTQTPGFFELKRGRDVGPDFS